jgi:hypothetical protein
MSLKYGSCWVACEARAKRNRSGPVPIGQNGEEFSAPAALPSRVGPWAVFGKTYDLTFDLSGRETNPKYVELPGRS